MSLSKVDAVNQTLLLIGETPVNTLDGQTSKNARIAEAHWDRANRMAQGEGWHFNVDPSTFLEADATTGKIAVPADVLRIKVADAYWIVPRGGFLYDRRAETDVLNAAKECSIVRFVEFDDLSDDFKAYVSARAARAMYSSHIDTEGPIPQGLVAEERMARALIMEHDADVADHNLMDDPQLPLLYGSEFVPGTPRKHPDY